MDKLEALSSVMGKPNKQDKKNTDVIMNIILSIMCYAHRSANSQAQANAKFFKTCIRRELLNLRMELGNLGEECDHYKLNRELHRLYYISKERYKRMHWMYPTDPKESVSPKKCPWTINDFMIHQDRGETIPIVADKIINKLRKENKKYEYGR